MAGSRSGTPNPRIKRIKRIRGASAPLRRPVRGRERAAPAQLLTFGENNKVKRCQEMSRGQGQKATNVSAFDKHPG